MLRNRKDHFLPRVYLKEFINPSRRGLDRPLWVFEVRSHTWNPKSTAAIGYERGFYDYSSAAEAALGITTADSCFQDLEGSYGKVHDDLKKTSYRSWQDHLSYLLRFGQMLRSRSALFIAQQMEQTNASILGVIESISEDSRTIKYREPTHEEIAPEKLRDHALSAMRREIEAGVSWMGDFEWQIGLAPGVLDPFVVSENPVAMTGPSQSATKNYHHPLCEIQIPLSWKACLFGIRTRNFDIYKMSTMTSGQMHYFRSQCFKHARDFVISPTNLI